MDEAEFFKTFFEEHQDTIKELKKDGFLTPSEIEAAEMAVPGIFNASSPKKRSVLKRQKNGNGSGNGRTKSGNGNGSKNQGNGNGRARRKRENIVKLVNAQ